MKIDMHSFFDGLAGEENVDMEFHDVEKLQINTERIKELTMKKISTENSRKLKKPLRVALIAAAAMVLFAGTVSAAVSLGVKVNTNVPKEEEFDGYSYDIGAEISVPSAGGKPVLVGFRLGYQPEMNEPEVEETLGDLYEEAGNSSYFLLLEEKGIVSMTDIIDDNYTEVTEEDIAAYLAKHGVTEESAEGAYVHAFRNDGNIWWGADIRSDVPVDTTYILEGETTVAKEGILRGMSAVYLESVEPLSGQNMNVLTLRDETSGLLVVVYGSESFEELEKIAEGLEIVPTTVPDYWGNRNFDFGGILASCGQG